MKLPSGSSAENIQGSATKWKVSLQEPWVNLLSHMKELGLCYC